MTSAGRLETRSTVRGAIRELAYRQSNIIPILATMRMMRLLNRLAPVLLAIYWPLVFFGTHLPIRPGGGGELPVNDKLIHAAIFFGLGFLLALAALGGSRGGAGPSRDGVVLGGWMSLLAIGVGYAGLDEWSQRFVAGRYPDLRDFVADVGGFVLGLGVGMAIARWGRPGRDHSQDPAAGFDEGSN